MKKIGEYTCRGRVGFDGQSLSDGAETKIILDDGDFTTGYRLVEFKVATGDQSHPDLTARVATEPGLSTDVDGFWDWSDNRQVAWASTDGSTDIAAVRDFSLVDPDNLIIQDAYVAFRFVSSTGTFANYFMRFEKYDITDSQGALAMVRNRSQA